MTNRIILQPNDTGLFMGALAQPYAYKPTLRWILSAILAHHGDNRFFVLDGATVRAAQTTKAGAERYMQPNRVLLELEP